MRVVAASTSRCRGDRSVQIHHRQIHHARCCRGFGGRDRGLLDRGGPGSECQIAGRRAARQGRPASHARPWSRVFVAQLALLRSGLSIRSQEARQRSRGGSPHRAPLGKRGFSIPASRNALGWRHADPTRALMADIRKEDILAVENAGLRELLTQAGIDAARLLAQAGIDATATESARKLQHLLLEELHHRVKNTLATVMAITSQSLRTAETLEQGRLAVESRLIALGKAHDLLLQSKWTGAKLTDLIHTAIEPFDSDDVRRFAVRETETEVG